MQMTLSQRVTAMTVVAMQEGGDDIDCDCLENDCDCDCDDDRD